MNTFYLYTLSLEDYEIIATNPDLNSDKRRLKLSNHLLISGTNRRVITRMLHLQAANEVQTSKLSRDEFQVYSVRYEQVQEIVTQELQLAAGHFSHTIHKVNMAAFYYLSFTTERELTAILVKDEPEGIATRTWEGRPPTPLMNRFYGEE